MSESTAVLIAQDWIDAFNARDLQRLVALADERLELVRVGGARLGRHQLGELLDRQSYGVGLRVESRRYFQRADTVVVDALAQWRLVETDALADSDERALVVEIRDGRVARMRIHRALDGALEATGLTESDEVLADRAV